ncbi:polyprenyl synthetase family protein [Alicyclobacillus acidocaldarius]|uniref:Polyprenyl synthetase n=1 Tax=Alicyclobacillus acidocaldarius (strain Tc-4-1) TaxID=1048834 RepID=F8IDK2_ALIAT|nr:polyprenyl synthetase family protein [Alicyclobacillus acidocaldarius]AEJ45045.1 Polyprenyl synthetase [Alicyclobacillus acidocaldarius subsp. acidocaldarius Tc-4-1]
MLITTTARDMLQSIEEHLARATASTSDSQGEIGAMIRYHLGVHAAPPSRPLGHSKRVRPLLLLTAHAALGGDWRAALPAAVAIEYVHGFSLIHDDIEDRSPLRRGRASLWAVWGVDRALNAGDALFALAFRVMGDLADHFDPRWVVEAYQAMTDACIALSAGQELDLAFEQVENVSIEQYLAMAELKTGALFGAALEVAAILAGHPPSVRDDLRNAGRKLGVLFQILDDFHDVFSCEEDLGKPTAQDALRRKKTLPVVLGLSRDREFAEMWRCLRDNQEMLPHLRARLVTDSILGEAIAIEERVRAELQHRIERAPFVDAWKPEILETIHRLVQRRR